MLTFRDQLNSSDLAAIKKIASSTGFFDETDVRICVSLAEKNLYDHDKSCEFMLADYNGETVAYVCYGLLSDAAPGTYEIFWLSTLNDYRGCGIGRELLERLFDNLIRRGAHRVYLKTESKAQYLPTRNFYERCGFTEQAVLKGYYQDRDDCCIYAKTFTASAEQSLNRYVAAAE